MDQVSPFERVPYRDAHDCTVKKKPDLPAGLLQQSVNKTI